MAALFSFVILAVLIAAVAFVGPRVTRTLRVKTNVIVTGAYLAVLVILSAAVFLIPPASLLAPLGSETDAGAVSQKDLVKRLADGNFDAPAGFTKTEASYDLTAGHLTVSGELYDDKGVVYVGVKGINVPDDGSDDVDILSYTYGTVSFNSVHYPIIIQPPLISFEGGANPRLTIGYGSERHPADFKQFDDSLTAKRTLDSTHLSHGGTTSSAAVVVLLPPGTSWSGDGTVPLSSYSDPDI